MTLSCFRFVAPRKISNYSRNALYFLALILIIMELSPGPVRSIDLIIKCNEFFAHLWKHQPRVSNP